MKSLHIAYLFISFLCLILLVGCSKDEDLPEDDNYIYAFKSDSLFIEATTKVPRRSEGDFLILKDGSVLTVYTRFLGGVGDHSNAVLSGRISFSKGITWNEEFDIISKEGLLNVMSVSLLRLQNDSIAIFYLVKDSEKDCFPVMRVSGDEGKKWSERRFIQSPGCGYHVMNNSRAIQLKSGRLLVPVSLHAYSNNALEQNGSIFCFYSDDNGVTWKKGYSVPKPANVITQEPGVVELKDGRILIYMRTASGYQYFSYSSDSGMNWSFAKQGTLCSPQSPALIVRNPYNKLLVAIWNDSKTSQRTPLCIAYSADEGVSWKRKAYIENNPALWFCYPAIEFLDASTVLVSYSAGLPANWGFGALRIVRLSAHSLWNK